MQAKINESHDHVAQLDLERDKCIQCEMTNQLPHCAMHYLFNLPCVPDKMTGA